ncbi:MAG: hypothetical protein HOP15_04880 [Planctomycetes bacterium]|nr:hypothetical protein [Planctomycetota bacterium]
MLSILGLFSAATLLQGQVHVVDGAGGPGADFTTIFAAVNAAADGDVVLVRSGNYLSDGPGKPNKGLDLLDIPGRSLVVLAERGASVRTNSLQVHGLSRGEWALVQGIRFEQQGIAGWLTDNQGPVWLESCTLRALPFVNDHDAMRVQDCDSVVMTRCEIEAPVIQTGILATRSRLQLWQSVARGGPAVRLIQASISLSGSWVHGMDGLDSSGPPFFPNGNGGDGGDGLVLQLRSQVWLQDSILEGGAGGTPTGSGLPGADGEALVILTGRTHAVAGSSKALELSSPVREGAPVTLTVRGKPGDLVWLRLALSPDGLAHRGLAPGLFLGRIPAGGVLVLTLSAPNLPAGREGLVFFCQATVRDTDSQRFVASSPSALVLLDRNL